MFPVIGNNPALVATNGAMLPVPPETNPIDVLEFTHVYEFPVPEKIN